MNTQEPNVSERPQDAARETPVDMNALQNIFGDNMEAQLSLLQKFVVQMDEILASIEAAHAQQDAEGIKFHAHKLKSSARAVGANRVSDACFEMETAGREADWMKISPQIGILQSAAEKVRSYVAAL